MRQYTINGKPFWFVTTYELAKITHKNSRTLFRWEKRGILPRPSVTRKKVTGLGEFEQRLYLEEQVKLLLAWMEKYQLFGARVVRPEWIEELHLEWKKIESKLKITIGESNGKVTETNTEKEYDRVASNESGSVLRNDAQSG